MNIWQKVIRQRSGKRTKRTGIKNFTFIGSIKSLLIPAVNSEGTEDTDTFTTKLPWQGKQCELYFGDPLNF